MTALSPKAPCIEKYITVTQKDLPLCCPLPDREVWNAHPRVYFPIQETQEYLCPYCGTLYTLKDSSQ